MLLGFLMLPLKRRQEPGRFRLDRQHAGGKHRLLSTVFADLQRLGGKRRNPRIRYGQCIDSHGIVGNLHLSANEGEIGFILPATETNTAGLVNNPGLVVQEGFSNDTRIQISEGYGIAVKFLAGRNAFLRNIHALALVILCNAFVGFVVVVFLDKQLPVFVSILQGFNLLSLAFRDIGVNQPVVDLYFALLM